MILSVPTPEKRRAQAQQAAADKVMLEIGEARVLYATWQILKKKVLTDVRKKWLQKTYGNGSVDRITQYMKMLHSGEML